MATDGFCVTTAGNRYLCCGMQTLPEMLALASQFWVRGEQNDGSRIGDLRVQRLARYSYVCESKLRIYNNSGCLLL